MLIQKTDHPQFKLNNFEGPLAFLLYLVQKHELDVTEVPLREIAEQYIQHLQKVPVASVEDGAEFIGTAAWLLWLKSKLLLPSHEGLELEGLEGESPFAILPQLVEYLQFKQISHELAERQQQQSAYYVRGCEEEYEPQKKWAGVEHLSVQDLCTVFQQALQKAQLERGMIHEEVWRVSDKIEFLREAIKSRVSIELPGLFASLSCREELIVMFLAILEMMKLGELGIIKELHSGGICLIQVRTHG